MAKSKPSTNGSNGADRDAKGRFVKGNPGGPGNPFGKQVAVWRAAMLATITDKDVAMVIGRIISQAKAGDITACKLFMDRVFGPPVPIDLVARIEELEQALAEQSR